MGEIISNKFADAPKPHLAFLIKPSSKRKMRLITPEQFSRTYTFSNPGQVYSYPNNSSCRKSAMQRIIYQEQSNLC